MSVVVWTAEYAHDATFLAFWLGGAAEAVGDAASGGGGAAGACTGVAKVTGACVLGFVGWFALFAMSWLYRGAD